MHGRSVDFISLNEAGILCEAVIPFALAVSYAGAIFPRHPFH
jgi:hypothetical protein